MIFDTVQLNFEDLQEAKKQRGHPIDKTQEPEIIGDKEPSPNRSTSKSFDLLEVIEGERPLEEGETVKNEFKF